MKIAKLVVFLVSLFGVVSFFITGHWVIPYLCGEHNYECEDRFEILFPILFLFFPTLFLSIITFFLRDEIFRAWLEFAYWWLPISVIIVSIFAKLSSGGGGWGIPNVLDAGSVSGMLSIIFFVMSIIIIIGESANLKTKKRNKN